MASTSSKFFAVIAGAGPGTGRATAVRFSKAYPVVLLARQPASYEGAVAEINNDGKSQRAVGVSADASDPGSLNTAFETIAREFPAADGWRLAAAIYNVGGGFGRGPFLDVSVDALDASLAANARGFFNFAQKTIPLLLETASSSSQHPPTLIATGATASVRGSANFGPFAAGMFARRALAQSLAREFGPRGVHVAHAIIDGVIDIPRTRIPAFAGVNGGAEDGRISADAIAESYWHLHTQHRSAFTQEIDIRPYVEKF